MARIGRSTVSQPPVVLGLDFGGTKIAMMVCEPSGERLASSTVASGGELGARASFERGIQAARALLAGALAGCDPAVYLNLGTGLSAAIVAGGQVLSGANGAAGEIGYNLRILSDVG